MKKPLGSVEDTGISPLDNPQIRLLRQMIEGATRLVALTGAGISTESGIPDFRSPGGIWSRMKPITYEMFLHSEAARLEDWRRRFILNESFAAAEPNAGHRALARLAQRGRITALITQNIDGLHQRAGFAADRLIELHGNATHGHCLDCRADMALSTVRDAISFSGQSPRCACGGLVKAAIVSFGEAIPERVLRRAAEFAAQADLLLVVGTSLAVRPASSLPLLSIKSGGRLVIINREPTPLDAEAALTIRGSIGAVFESIAAQSVN